MSAFVYTTAGGIRFHEDADCGGLAGGLRLAGGRYSPQGVRYKVRALWSVDAARAGYTACRVCVPTALALPDTGQTYGHEPAPGEGWFGEPETICARCTHPGLWWGDPTYRMPVHVLWPCMSAVVLGLVPRDGAL